MNLSEARKKLGLNTLDIDCAVLIKGLRIDLGLTQQELANKCGMKQEEIARIESANHYPTIKTLEKIAKSVGRKLVMSFEPITNY